MMQYVGLFLTGVILGFLIIINTVPLTRYNKLKRCKTNEYIIKYKDIGKCVKDKVVLSLTTKENNMNKLRATLNSLLNQTSKVDQIFLNIPEEYNMPEDIKNMCNVFVVGKDYGKGTNYIPTLLREKECGTIILLLDDDIIYGKDFIEKIIKESMNNPNNCIYTGENFTKAKGILIKPEYVNTITRDVCDYNWLENNLNVKKIRMHYKENYLQ